jgi:regulator of sigma E protease
MMDSLAAVSVFSQVPNWVLVGVVFIVMMSLLVAAHEYGHYLFARWFGMGVEEFSIGFGSKPLFVWKRDTYDIPVPNGYEPSEAETFSVGSSLEGGTRRRRIEVVEKPDGTVLRETTDFTVRPWPLGGYVRIKGMLPEEDGSETRIPGGFYSKSPFQRLLVLFAGPLFSILFGMIVLVGVFMTWGQPMADTRPIVAGVVPGSPADKAGITKGDRIVRIAGKPVNEWYDVLSVVRVSANERLSATIERDGKRLDVTVVPFLDPSPTPVYGRNLEPTFDFKQQGKMGAGWNDIRVRHSFVGALRAACYEPVRAVVGVATIFMRPRTFEQQVGGPVQMVSITNAAVRSGVEYVVYLAAMLSISVGILNLLPCPPLDGGQMVVAFAEMLRRGRRLSLKTQAIANGIGMAAVMTLIFSVLFIDVKRLVEGPRKQAEFRRVLEEHNAGTK